MRNDISALFERTLLKKNVFYVLLCVSINKLANANVLELNCCICKLLNKSKILNKIQQGTYNVSDWD